MPMKPLTELQGVVTGLPRGGYLVDTPSGYFQFGSPPETIKDTMRLPGGVPQVFVLPNALFSWIKGISVAEIEFPIYYNYFLKKKKTYIICHENQFDRMKNVLREAVFGPEKLDVSSDFDTVCSECNVPDLRREMNYFRNNLSLSDLVSFGIFKNNRFTFRGITVEKHNGTEFLVKKEGELLATVPGIIEYKPTYNIGARLPEPYMPPLFAVTCLGPSHGFDPEDNTSGYIIWLNHRGIMVDPPVNSTEWLEDSNVNPKLIDSIILTHCHADHDAGTFQKILEEGKITVYSTETVMLSFLRKYSHLSGMPVEYLMRLFSFKPVRIGSPVFINSARFNFFYTLHSIPAIGFRMEFQDQTFVYSSDHNNDPDVHDEIFKKGIISRERYDELRNFPWDSRVIYHESGIPPLHTPVAFLNSLPEQVQDRIVVYHIAKKDFPTDTRLKLATFGIENTLVFGTTPPPFTQANMILGILSRLDFLDDLPIGKAEEFLNIVREERFSKGDLIIRKGTRGDRFFIIYSGNVRVESGALEESKIYGAYEYFGEVALVTEQNRAADVYAETDVIAYTIGRDEFLWFIEGTRFEKTLKRLARIRTSETWNLLSTSKYFQHCTSSQKTWLESMFVEVEIAGEGTLIAEGDYMQDVYVIRSGEVEVTKDGKRIAVLGRGDFVGSMPRLHMEEPSAFTFSHEGQVSLYAMPGGEVYEFLEKNPGLIMKLEHDI